MSSSIQVEAARIPDRDKMVELLQSHGLDARPANEVGIEVHTENTDQVFQEVEELIIDLGATMIPQKHEGVIYIRPPVS
jgi:hypothetical protein